MNDTVKLHYLEGYMNQYTAVFFLVFDGITDNSATGNKENVE